MLEHLMSSPDARPACEKVPEVRQSAAGEESLTNSLAALPRVT